eukprot:CAMPEP_0201484924 /NCGR_PEP_ID=MMETSP0151_2-20130828/9072_1 /ASSEMBLY_ACC=CAM_ASM_000257 /TAXON_ID=200890 /ORGANISM="Paramoeba atlantica, Strain 621/1 / CCAP 1560/9" /LENGTH=126 /DNA_ID=CAMNT_0047868813 /DNA_START=37 /DNA_END=417 /DNA_ORIENTATION=+
MATPNIGDTVEFIDVGDVYSTLNQNESFWEGTPTEWRMWGGNEGFTENREQRVVGWGVHHFCPTDGMKGTVVHLWPPFFPVGCWRYDDSSKILVEVEKGETKFYVPIRERAVKILESLPIVKPAKR